MSVSPGFQIRWRIVTADCLFFPAVSVSQSEGNARDAVIA